MKIDEETLKQIKYGSMPINSLEYIFMYLFKNRDSFQENNVRALKMMCVLSIISKEMDEIAEDVAHFSYSLNYCLYNNHESKFKQFINGIKNTDIDTFGKYNLQYFLGENFMEKYEDYDLKISDIKLRCKEISKNNIENLENAINNNNVDNILLFIENMHLLKKNLNDEVLELREKSKDIIKNIKNLELIKDKKINIDINKILSENFMDGMFFNIKEKINLTDFVKLKIKKMLDFVDLVYAYSNCENKENGMVSKFLVHENLKKGLDFLQNIDCKETILYDKDLIFSVYRSLHRNYSFEDDLDIINKIFREKELESMMVGIKDTEIKKIKI